METSSPFQGCAAQAKPKPLILQSDRWQSDRWTAAMITGHGQMCVFQAALYAELYPLEEQADESIRNDVAGNRVDHD
ncbi:hypothetical protein [Xanthomonas arboricola]|uniref:hypothetical protein n=1 Tax=Xanthomonas arboricola TaxID=56448 RepID=UPI000F8EC398|nr:hypothetical protein [Xanthomonas arboricola]